MAVVRLERMGVQHYWVWRMLLLVVIACWLGTVAAVSSNSTAMPNDVHSVVYPTLEELNEAFHLQSVGVSDEHGGIPQMGSSPHAWSESRATHWGNTSDCSEVSGCPRSAMVWASGTFTFAELLTPSSFARETNLTLKLSLCCRYLFRGHMLVDEYLYDHFLEVLLQASPFHALTAHERRLLFPRQKALIVHTKPSKREPFPEDVSKADRQQRSDGDGDVLYLVTGKLGAQTLSRILFATTRGIGGTGHSSAASGPEPSSSPTSLPLPSRIHGVEPKDMQLKIVNTVLRCKCPHTLLVMPVLHIQPDALPPIRILGLGSHCGVLPSQRPVAPHRRIIRVHMREDDAGATHFATSFLVSPSLGPLTEVTWTVSVAATTEANATIVLRHQRLLPAVLDEEGALQRSDAASPYVLVQQGLQYDVTVSIRKGDGVEQKASGLFMLRVPLDRHWDIPTTSPMPYFGINRVLRLDKSTLEQEALQRAFNMASTAVPPTGTPGTSAYKGYWENTPLEGQILPQHKVVVPHDPYREDNATFPLFLGQNVLQYVVHDADYVCDPVVVEKRELWALQGILLTQTPTTVCTEDIPLEALPLETLMSTMRYVKGFAISFAHEGATVERNDSKGGATAAGIEGVFRYRRRKPFRPDQRNTRYPEYYGPPDEVPTPAESPHGTTVYLRPAHRGLFDVEWVVRITVSDLTLLQPEHLDPRVSVVTPASLNSTGAAIVEVRSHSHVVVHRAALLPQRMKVQLPMHERVWRAYPPRYQAQQPKPHNASHLGDPHDPTSALESNDPVSGRWVARDPLTILSVDEHLIAVLDTARVPNVQRRLPNGTLHFMAEDGGEDLTRAYGIHYVARCPDVLMEVEVDVIALPAPPVVPAFEPVYTEEGCVELKPPREARKDEVVEWRVPSCMEAKRSPRVVERLTDTSPAGMAGESVSRRVWFACGVQANHRCEVVWSATNLVGTVEKTYSLRRCMKPPDLVFHADKLQLEHAVPSRVYRLPYIDEKGQVMLPTDSSFLPDGRERRVIPLAGSTGDVGYSFNVSVSQKFFEAELRSLQYRASHQLPVTQMHVDPTRLGGDQVTLPPLVLRHRYALDKETDSPDQWRPYPMLKTEDIVTEDLGSWLDYRNRGGSLDHSAFLLERHYRVRRRRDALLDDEADNKFHLTHYVNHRRLEFQRLCNSSFHPIDYLVRTSTSLPNAFTVEDSAEFAKRGMCVARQGLAAVLALSPRGAVVEDSRYGAALPPPPQPAVAVVPFCSSQYVFSRHPELHSVLHYHFTWVCPEASNMVVERRSPTYSVVTRLPTEGSGNESLCKLTVRNELTNTARSDWFLLKRVYPTTMAPTFVILSQNVASRQMERPTRTPPPGKAVRYLLGKSVVLHVDAPADAMTSDWRVVSFVRATSASAGTQSIMGGVQFVPLYQHPAAIERGLGGATVLVKGMQTPGVYTIAHESPDPVYPGICPPVTVVETFHVMHAEVREKELFICGETAVLQAVPLSQELQSQFVGRWEVLSLQTSPDEVWTDGSKLSGIRFRTRHLPHTLVEGLPFGIVTIRWAVYRRPIGPAGGSTAPDADATFRGPVDFDTVRVIVLTENVRSNTHVTLSDTAELLGTSSTVEWKIEEDASRVARLSVKSVGNLSNLNERDLGAFSTAALDNGDGNLSATLRPGMSLVTVTNLPVGVLQLGYRLQPSTNAFGPMLGHTCTLRGTAIIERVSAYLTANSTLDHECEAYTGKGKITLCLHAELSSKALMAHGKVAGATVGTDGWTSRVRLVAPEVIEKTIKAGAQEMERSGCVTPWWVWPSTTWDDVHYVDRDGVPPHRCVSFVVRAGRHLSPLEVASPLFIATENALPIGAVAEGTAQASSQRCPIGGDFITSRVIDGAHLHEKDAPMTKGKAPSDGHFSRLPYGPRSCLPILRRDTLRRVDQGMRPMIGQQGLPDEVTTEVDVSRGNVSVVTLRLDASQPRQLGGFVPSLAQGTKFSERRHSLLMKCAQGTATAGEILGMWTESNQPDGATSGTAEEWLDYVNAVRDSPLPCEVLFVSLEHLLARTGGVSLPTDGEARRPLRHHAEAHVPPTRQRLVSLSVIEQQLESLHMEYRWTAEGIDVTGLRRDLQEALSRRRITKQQLRLVEEARLQRQQRVEERHRTGLALATAPSNMTVSERLLSALKLYKGVAQEEATALRIRLPRHDAFSVPYSLFLRVALHKDIICGSNVSYPRKTVGPIANPNSIVMLGKVEITDVAPAVMVAPLTVKQCEIEASIPVLHVNVTGTTFTRRTFQAADVTLEELSNRNISSRSPSSRVGLQPCLSHLLDGAQIAVGVSTRKDLYVQLSPCPFFKMLDEEEYNERQDSESVLRRLREPRLLQVTVKDALSPDSFTNRKGQRPSTSGRQSPPLQSRDVVFVVKVLPTLARLHLRSIPRIGRDIVSRSPVESSLLRSFPAELVRQPVLCEVDMRSNGFELGVELVGDHWTDPVGDNQPFTEFEHEEDAPPGKMVSISAHAPHGDTSADTADHISRFGEAWTVRRRAPHNIALINSFSVVEHHSLDSTHHLYLKAAGSYRSSFVSYLFSCVLADRHVMHRHMFVQRYNRTFISIDIPPQSSDSRCRMVDEAEEDEYAASFNDVSWQSSSTAQSSPSLPAIRRFSKIEEVLFAVPGLSTECQGCLLADTTFFVAGDLTGWWKFGTQDVSQSSESSVSTNRDSLVTPIVLPFHAAEVIPREWLFTWVCPHGAVRALQQLIRRWSLSSHGRSLPNLFFQMEVVLYTARDALGFEIPFSQRPTVLLRSTPISVSKSLSGRIGGTALALPLHFLVNQSSAEKAYTSLAADLLRYHRPHTFSSFDYHRSDSHAGGRLVVNASALVKVCVPLVHETAVGQPACMVVSLSDMLLVVETPREPRGKFLSAFFRRSSVVRGPVSHGAHSIPRSALSITSLVHNTLLTFLFYTVLPLAVESFEDEEQVQKLESGSTASLSSSVSLLRLAMEDRHRARVAYAGMLFVLLVFSFAIAPPLWVLSWLGVWCVVLYLSRRADAIIAFVLSVVYWRYLM